ncbi:hypothetical protein EV126DRAFT_119201 [Verticillium dahliae]|nr:hypothetical protein EV126DRAFT_119201 [Verticillium dahliae]
MWLETLSALVVVSPGLLDLHGASRISLALAAMGPFSPSRHLLGFMSWIKGEFRPSLAAFRSTSPLRASVFVFYVPRGDPAPESTSWHASHCFVANAATITVSEEHAASPNLFSVQLVLSWQTRTHSNHLNHRTRHLSGSRGLPDTARGQLVSG